MTKLLTQDSAMKRIRASAAEIAIKALGDVARGLPPVPPHVTLRDADLPFWCGIVRARAADEWSGADLVVAAQLARCQADIECEQKLMDAESSVLVNFKGTPVANPRMSVIEQLARREMALMRALRMGGHVVGDVRNETGRRKASATAERVAKTIEGDELLARPGLQ